MTKPTDHITLLPYRDRVKLVQNRLATFRRNFKAVPLKVPAKVAAAKLLVAEWTEKSREHERVQEEAWRQKLHEVEDALIVGNTQKAVELIAKLKY